MAAVFFDLNKITPNLTRLMPAIDAAVDLAFDAAAPRAESYMRENARWTDRTGNARAGLKAAHQKVPMEYHELVVYHSMPYGIWLEVRGSGRYAIIGPTLEAMGPEVMQLVEASIQRALKGL